MNVVEEPPEEASPHCGHPVGACICADIASWAEEPDPYPTADVEEGEQ